MGRWLPTPGEPRSSGRALVLTFAVPLVGYAYVGRLERGFVVVAAGLSIAASLSYLPFGLMNFRLFAILGAAAFLIARLIFAVDAALLVRRGRSRLGVPDQSIFVYVGVFVASLVAAVIYHGLARAWIFTTTQLCEKSNNVQPAIWPEDCVLVAPGGRWGRGDLVYYGGRFGRVVGLPGDRVEVRDGVPVVNGSTFLQTPAPQPPTAATRFRPDIVIPSTETNPEGRSYVVLRLKDAGPHVDDDTAERRVPEGRVFVLNDLRDGAHGFDSRAEVIGDLPISDILGTPVMVSRSSDWRRIGALVR